MKTAWVLSGGGARGCFQVGVLAALSKQGKPDLVIGCSAGALNAAGFAFQGPHWLVDEWKGIRGIWDAYRPCFEPLGGGVLDAAPERELIAKAIPVGATPMLECVVNYSDLLSDTEKTAFATRSTVEDFRLAVEASTTIPGIAAPVAGRFVDGGVNQMAPLSQAMGLNVERIIVVSCFPMEPQPIKELRWPRTVSTIFRAVESALRKSLIKDIALCRALGAKVTVIAPPPEWTATPFDFSKETIAEGIALGEQLGW